MGRLGSISTLLIGAVLLVGFGHAESTTDNFDVGPENATLDQAIILTIPARVALHISDTDWTLDLNSIQNTVSESCYLVPKTFEFTGAPEAATRQVFDAYYRHELSPVATYPAISPGDNNMIDDDSEKGGLLCTKELIIQKFCNSAPCQMDVKFRRSGPSSQPSFGTFFIYDEFLEGGGLQGASDPADVVPSTGSGVYHEPVLNAYSILMHLQTSKLTGWVDDRIIEGFYLDGSEVGGATHTFKLDFVLVGGF